MKAVVLTEPFPSNPSARVALRTDWPDPAKPGPGMAIVRTLCSALNHLDLWMARGMMGPSIRYPAVSGSDACGIVEAVGPGVDAAWMGRQVILNAAVEQSDHGQPGAPPPSSTPSYQMIGEHLSGTHAEKFAAPVANLAAVDGLDPIEAAAFGLTHLTAYSMLVTKAGIRPGQVVLITGIGGGVALAALAIARHVGCQTIVTSRASLKLEQAKALGADHLVHDDGSDWSKTVRTITNKRGVDVAVDSSGKDTHAKALRSLCRGGTYVTCGATSGGDATTDLSRLFWMQLRILGSTMSTNAEFHQVVALYRKGYLKPVIDRVFSADGAADAIARLQSSGQFGKVVLDWR